MGFMAVGNPSTGLQAFWENGARGVWYTSTAIVEKKEGSEGGAFRGGIELMDWPWFTRSLTHPPTIP